MIEAMKCAGGVYRVDDNGQVYIFDSYEELTENYNIVGVLTPSMFLTYIVTTKIN
jgi:hypothetical protein